MKKLKYLPLLFVLILSGCGNDDPDNKKDIVKEIVIPVNSITVDNNNTKWIGTDAGLYKSVDGGYELQELSDTGKVITVFFDSPSNALWICTPKSLFKATVNGDDLDEEVIDKSKLSDSKILAFHSDNQSRRWFGTGKGISLNKNGNWKKSKFSVNMYGTQFAMDIEDFAVNSIASWDGDYFFATSGAKLYRAYNYDQQVDAFSGATQWDPPYNGLSITDTMFVVFIDKTGNQWMGGTEGIQVHSGHEPKDMGSFTYYYDELPDPYVLSICQAPDEKIWVGTRKGIAVFNGIHWETKTNGLPDLYINSMAVDKDGITWVGTKKGLVKF
jgi:ligand-binding sensor domain-containing protein